MLLQTGSSIEIGLIKVHIGIAGNEVASELATNVAKKDLKLKSWLP